MLTHMPAMKQKYMRSSLNKNQIRLLELVYKYRFVSRLLVADSLGVKPENGLFRRFEVLVKYEYLSKRFDKRLKLMGVPVAYCLTPKGLRALQAIPGHEYITEAIIKSSYRDTSVGQSFIAHTLDVYHYANTLMRHYPDLRVFTRREIGRYEYFPEQLPDAVLSLPTENPKQPKRFFLDLIPSAAPRRTIDGRLTAYCNFFDEGGWDITGSTLPVLLLVAETSSSEKRLQYIARTVMRRNDLVEPSIYTTTSPALSAEDATAIWTSLDDPDELLSLDRI